MGQDDRDRRRSRWRGVVVAKAISTRYERARLEVRAHQNLDPAKNVDQIVQAVWSSTEHHLQEALSAAKPRGPLGRIRGLIARDEGARINTAFVNLHHAKVGLVDLYGREDIIAAAPAVLTRMRNYGRAGDPRLTMAESVLDATLLVSAPERRRFEILRRTNRTPHPLPLPVQRAALREAMQVSYETADELHAQARGFRYVLILAIAWLTLQAIALCILGVAQPKAIPLCFPGDEANEIPPACPSTTGTVGGTIEPSQLDVSIVALMGLIGGALSVTFTVQRLRGTAPYDIPLALSLIKLPSGAVTGVVGVLLIHGEFIPGLSTLDSQGQILAWAIFLGFAQHLVTRVIDQKAEQVINSVPRKAGRPTRASTDQAEDRDEASGAG